MVTSENKVPESLDRAIDEGYSSLREFHTLNLKVS